MRTRRNGFSVLEVILGLTLVALVSTAVGTTMADGARMFLLGRENTRLAQRAQLPLGRLARELQELRSVSSSSSKSLTFQTLVGSRVINFANGTVTLKAGSQDPTILAENVDSFELRYKDGDGNDWSSSVDQLYIVEVSIGLRRQDGMQVQVYSIGVNPRNTGVTNAP